MSDFEFVPLQSILSDHRMFSTDFQVDVFMVIRARATPWGAYRQVIHEIDGFVTSLRDDMIRRNEMIASHDPNGRSLFEMEHLEQKIVARCRMLARLWAHASNLKRHLGDIDAKRRFELDREEWLTHLTRRAAFERWGHNAPTKWLEETFCALDPEDLKWILRQLKAANDRPEGLMSIVMETSRVVRDALGTLPPSDELLQDLTTRIMEMVQQCPISLPITSQDFSSLELSMSQLSGKSCLPMA